MLAIPYSSVDSMPKSWCNRIALAGLVASALFAVVILLVAPTAPGGPPTGVRAAATVTYGLMWAAAWGMVGLVARALGTLTEGTSARLLNMAGIRVRNAEADTPRVNSGRAAFIGGFLFLSLFGELAFFSGEPLVGLLVKLPAAALVWVYATENSFSKSRRLVHTVLSLFTILWLVPLVVLARTPQAAVKQTVEPTGGWSFLDTSAGPLTQDEVDGPGHSTVAGLERLVALHRGGALTDDEFASAKRRLLG